MRNRLVSTVGTSIFNNIRGEFRDSMGVAEEVHQSLQRLLQQRNWGQLGLNFAKINESARICGAEINSLDEVVRRRMKGIELEFIHLFVSDTEEGKRIGELIETYVDKHTINGLKPQTKQHVIEDLQDEIPARFKVYGLRNLVRELGKLVNQYGAETLIIDATGGYKAQIAIAVVFGQALSIPVLYRHERFSEIIEFPPMPISFDYDLLGENAGLLAAFERGDALTSTEIDTLDEKMRVLLEEIDVDGENIFELGAVGQIFLTGFRLRFPRSRRLQPVAPETRSSPSFPEHHWPLGYKDFVKKVWQETSWIKSIYSVDYSKQKGIKGVRFFVRNGELVGTYQDRSDFGARFKILTNADGQDQLTWAADQLNQSYGQNI